MQDLCKSVDFHSARRAKVRRIDFPKGDHRRPLSFWSTGPQRLDRHLRRFGSLWAIFLVLLASFLGTFGIILEPTSHILGAKN